MLRGASGSRLDYEICPALRRLNMLGLGSFRLAEVTPFDSSFSAIDSPWTRLAHGSTVVSSSGHLACIFSSRIAERRFGSLFMRIPLRSWRPSWILITALCLLGALRPAGADVIVNGSFE